MIRNVLLLIFLTACCFWPCLNADFVYWDDDLHLLNNPAVTTHSLENIRTIFTSAVNKTYIALTVLTFNLEHYFFGFNPFVYHFNNLLLHIAICLVIYFWAVRLGFNTTEAWMSALLFAVHPMHVESVAWITQRKDLLYSVCYLLSILYYWKFLTHNKKTWYWISLSLGFLSILAKPMALSLPLILLLLDWYHHGRINKQEILNKLPFLITIVPLANITYQLNARAVPVSFPDSFLIWTWSATFYIKKFLTPFVLLPLYQLPEPVSLTNPSYASSLLLLIALPAICLWRRHDKLLLFAVGFYVLSTFFLWRYDNTVDVTIVGDRFMYLPSLGFCLWIGSSLGKRITSHDPRWMAAAALLIIGAFVLTNQQCRIWKNDLTLWEHELKHEKRSALAYNSYGTALFKADRSNEALQSLNNALAINPDYAFAYYNRGRILADQENGRAALNDFTQALKLKPRHINSYLARGVLLSKHGREKEALADFNAAYQIDPNDARILNNRGIVYKRLGLDREAMEEFSKAVKLDPRLKSAQLNLDSIKRTLSLEKDLP